MSDRNFGSAIGLTGGADDNLDAISYAALSNNDIIFTTDSGDLYIHIYDSSSSAAESSPDVIAPDDIGAADGRHILLAVFDYHNGLSTLQGGTTDEYYHLTAAEHAAAIRDATSALKGLATAAQIDKLEKIEAEADKTDVTNVDAAGAVMESDFNAGTFLYAEGDNTPVVKTRAEILALLSGQAGANFSFNSKRITDVADPVSAQEAATKAYVDSVAQGLNVHDAVACATTGNITLSGEQTIDGVSTSTDRVLVKNRTAESENGIYVSAAGAWARASDFDADAEVSGSFIFVSEGTTNGATGWVCTNEPEASSVGSDDITFSQFSDAGYITAANGLTKSGNSIVPSGILEDLHSIGVPASDGQIIVATGAGVFVYESGATARASLGLSIGTHVLAQQTVGISDDNLLEVDDAGAASGKFGQFTANGMRGRAPVDALADLSGQAAAEFSFNTQKVGGIVDPTTDQQAATKKYVDDNRTHYLQYRILDKDTAHTVDTGVGGELRVPEACTVLGVGAYCDTAGAGSVTTIDINEAGSTILSTKITIDATEKSSKTAATPAVISDSAIAADAILTFDIDGIASGTAGEGLVVWLKVRF